MSPDPRVNPDKNWPFMYSLRGEHWYTTTQKPILDPTPVPRPTHGELEEEVGKARW